MGPGARVGPVTRWMVVAAVALSAGCGADEPRLRDDPFEAVDPAAVTSEEDRAKAAPRWRELETIHGTGEAEQRLAIPGESIQWRVRWRCAGRGALRMTTDPPQPDGGPVASGRCGASGIGEATRGGRVVLTVRTRGRWSAVVEQQVDSPIEEPPLQAMTAPGSRLLARGEFEDMERSGEGVVRLHRLDDGRLGLRFEDFRTTASSDLEVWVAPGRRPETSAAALERRHRSVAFLKATAGPQNYVLPSGIRPRDVGSVVLWCEPLNVAYASATLRP